MNKDEIMRLADAYADAVSDHRYETIAGASRSYTLEKARERDEARAALEAAIENAVLAQGEPVNEADELLRNLGLDPDTHRTDGGYINHFKVKAAIRAAIAAAEKEMK